MEAVLRALADESRRTLLDSLDRWSGDRSLRPEPLAEVDEWLGRYRALLEQRLDALHTEVARGKRERRSAR